MILFIILAQAGATAPVYAETYDRIVSTVNGDIITMYDIDSARKNMPGVANKTVLHDLVNKMLQNQFAKEKGITITRSDIDAAINDILKQNKISKEIFEKAIIAQGIDMAQYRQKLEADLLLMKLYNLEILSKSDVAEDSGLLEYYNLHRSDFTKNEERKISHILFAILPDDPVFNKKDAEERAVKVKKLLLDGASFSSLAKRYSDDPGGENGGELGFFKQGMLNATLDKAAFALSVGDVSEIIETTAGLHILRVDEVKKTDMLPFEDVKEKIRKIVQNEISAKLYNDWIGQLRANAYIEYKAGNPGKKGIQ